MKKSKRREPSKISTLVLKVALKEMKEVAFVAYKLTMQKWAKKAGVSDQTVYNLLNGTTRFPWFQTVVLLAHAVHLDLVTAEAGVVQLRMKGKTKDGKSHGIKITKTGKVSSL